MSDEVLEQKVPENLICFDEVLDITLVFQYYERFNEILNKQKSIVLNAEKIEKVDGAGLQLIATFIKSAETLNVQVTWSGISDAFKKNASLIGLSSSLGY